MRSFLSLGEAKTSPIQLLNDPLFSQKQIKCWVKREDQLAIEVQGNPFAFSGNKWRKLKYNLIQADKQGFDSLLSFGGAYSNHIAAVAAAAHHFNFKSIGIIRGEAREPLNPTLRFARACGMHLHYMSRSEYRRKEEPEVQGKLRQLYGASYIIPEGGTNPWALEGVKELAQEIRSQFEKLPDYMLLCCGTGGTTAGLIKGMKGQSQIRAYAVLKGSFLEKEIQNLLEGESYHNWKIENDFHCGGYAKTTPELLSFIRSFKKKFDISLDPIYTGKLFYALWHQVAAGHFPENSSILVIHSGGLQGIAGFEERLGVTLW